MCVSGVVVVRQTTPLQRAGAAVKLFGELSKVRLSGLVVMSTGLGYAFGMPSDWSASQLSLTCAGTFICAAAANTFNQCWEVKTDAMMKRTRLRPLPSGRISMVAALGVGAAASLAGPALLYLGTNSVVAALGASNILLYRSGVLFALHAVLLWIVHSSTAWGGCSGRAEPLAESTHCEFCLLL